MEFPIVIHQKPKKIETVLIIAILVITFIPFIYSIITSETKYCYSLLFGIIGIKFFNISTKNKFTYSKIIQKNTSINFTNEAIEILENKIKTTYNWSELSEIEINIYSFKGKTHDVDMFYSGIENSIKFIKNKVTYEYLFFIENANEYDLTKEHFKKMILPQLYQLRNVKNESILISKLDYTELQKFKEEYNINRYTGEIYFN